MGNPFQEESGDLLSLDAKDIASPSNAERIANRLSTGNASFEARLEALEQEDTSSFYAPIEKTKMDFFQQALHHCQREGAEGRLPGLLEILHFLPEQRM